jgi:hypothetical protein
MKALKGLLLFGISAFLVSACFNPPEFPLVPEIEFESIYFREARGVGEIDSLVFTISFRDGNGDLGLTSSQIDEPFHDENFYLALNGEITPIGKKSRYEDLPQFLSVPAGVSGKLVTVRTADDPAYQGTVPPYIDEVASCTYYTYDSVYISAENADIFDETYNIHRVMTSQGLPDVYVLLETFYYQRNPTHANIDVEWWVKENNVYTIYDWEKEFCTISFNQRFPVLAEKTGPLEGDLQYAMASAGIKNIFSIKPMKLRIKIRDRNLNVSNVVETPEFTLDKIKK